MQDRHFKNCELLKLLTSKPIYFFVIIATAKKIISGESLSDKTGLKYFPLKYLRQEYQG